MMATARGGIGVVVILIVVVVVGAAGFFVWQTTWVRDEEPDTTQSEYFSSEGANTAPQDSESAQLLWQQAENGWRPMGKVPACPTNPTFAPPTDLRQATAVLYPGQTRGGNYKPHGGFRFDGVTNNKVTVTAPLDGYIVRGGHYLAEGEIQYTFDIMNNCGLMYRVGHFRTLPATLQKIADMWPKAVEGDSRTHQVNPPLFVKQGEVLATSIGIVGSSNTFFDWGVYDYRTTNAASKSAAYQQAHAQDRELSWHAVCWFDLVSPSEEAKIRSLPAGDPTSGKTSDYCK